MTFIPKTERSEYDEKLRRIDGKLDELRGEMESLAKAKATEVTLPDANEAVPNAVNVAFAFIARFQQSVMPVCGESDVAVEFDNRYVLDSEIETVDSACELLQDYFDRHNSRVLRGRQLADAAPKPKNTPKGAIAVDPKPERGCR